MFLEPLENRLLLSADPLAMGAVAASLEVTGPSIIHWNNRGTAGDGFAATFGANADDARAVVDAAIDAWERVVANFNYLDGSNDFILDVVAGGGGSGASANHDRNGSNTITANEVDAQGKPHEGIINLGSVYWLDPTPYDSSEFLGAIDNAFSLNATPGGPAAGQADLFTVMALELTHLMGISTTNFTATGETLRLQLGGFVTDTGVVDPAGAGTAGVGNLWTFVGPSVTALLTGVNSGGDFTVPVHTAEPGSTAAGLFGSNDTGNAFFETGRRYLPSNLDALILKDAYDYDIAMPETFGTAYAVLNQTTGLLTVRGGTNNAGDPQNDVITVVRDGDEIVVSVDVEDDVAGTGPTNAFVSVFDAGQVLSVSVLAGDGDDSVVVGSDVNVPVTIEGGDGNDFLQGGDVTIMGGAGNDLIIGSEGADNLSGGAGDDTIHGLGGNDTINGDGDDDEIYAGTGDNSVTDGTGNDFVDLSENSVAITYTTGGGNDTVIGTAFNDTITGSSGADRLEGRGGNDSLIGAAGADTLIGGDGSDTLTWNPGDGSDVIEGGDGNDVMVFNGSGASEVFTLSAVGTRLQLLRDVGGITMDVAGVEQVNLNALGGADSATVNDLTGTDVQVVNIDLGVGDADSTTVNGRAVADNLTAAVSVSVVTVTGLNYDVNVSSATTADTLAVNGNDGNDTIKAVSPVESTIGIVLNGGNGDDFLSADATLNGGDGNDTLIGGAGADTLNGGAGDDVLDGRGGSNTLDGGADTDTILVSGTAGADTIATTHGAGSFDITGGLSAGTNTIAGMEAVRVEGGEGADKITLNLLAAGGLNYTVLGGNPIGAPGDVLQVNSGAAMTVTAGPENDAGSVDAATTTPTNVSYDEIELLIIGGGGGVINGTNGPDAITIIARDVSTHPGTDGVQDFTVSVNTGPEFLFINVPSLTVNALSGSDQVTLQTPAPNNAVWDVDVTVNGGAPAADTDRLIVQTPGADIETLVYTPGAADGGMLDLTSLSSLVTINTTEVLDYDGQGDNDNLTVVGTSGADAIVHMPGANDQAGSFQINSLLAISYQNLGSVASLTADGDAGTDTLSYNGTAANDTFTIGLTGQVNLNSRLVVNSMDVETLTLEGFDGDDSFTLIPAISDMVYTTLNLNGGAQASAAGDRVNLVATAGEDNITVSGQSVMLGGKTVVGNGIEDIRLDALAGDDLLSYNGVAGVTENINVSSSGVVGGGQVSVPGVTLVNFSGVERIDVNGNTPTPTETDSLTFAGTNAVDIFQIHLAADGTDADPILTLQNASSVTLLTLRNYTNFDTLRVLGLDGADTFNVMTDPITPVNRDLFVDGGLPAGKKKSTDKLNIFYTSPRPRIIHSAATQEPDAGLVDLDYGSARFLVQYDGIEQVVIRKS